MKLIKKSLLVTVLLGLFLSATLTADFAVKQEMVMSGIPMMGNLITKQTYLIKGDQLAIEQSMQNPMMPQMSTQTRSIVKGGNQIIIVNYMDSTYSMHGESMVDSLADMMDMLDDMVDSIKEMVTIKSIKMGMSGKTKDIKGHKAEEMAFIADVDIKAKMMGPEPMPMTIKIDGSYWGTKDFDDYNNYKKQMQVMQNLFFKSGQGGLTGMTPILEKLGIDKDMVEDAMQFSEYVPLEGTMKIVVDMEMTEEMKQGMGQMFKMPMTINMNTNLIEAAEAEIDASEFVQPEGFEKVDNAVMPGGGGFSPLGM